MRLSVSCAHLEWCEYEASICGDVSFISISAALPQLKIWAENSTYHAFNHNIR